MIIDGKAIAAKRLQELASQVARLKIKPKLVAILVGEDEASKMYVSLKTKRATEVGIISEIITLPATSTDAQVTTKIGELNANPKVTGILIQLPLPKGMNSQKILDTLASQKDVDGLTQCSPYLPATVKGIISLLTEPVEGKHVVIVGRSNLIGKPLAFAMIAAGATVTVCNSKTKNLQELTKLGDILVSATGKEGLITADMVKPGAIVIDCGSPRGEVDFEEVSKIASAITPVPGGVGPMTVVSLLENTLLAAEKSKKPIKV